MVPAVPTAHTSVGPEPHTDVRFTRRSTGSPLRNPGVAARSSLDADAAAVGRPLRVEPIRRFGRFGRVRRDARPRQEWPPAGSSTGGDSTSSPLAASRDRDGGERGRDGHGCHRPASALQGVRSSVGSSSVHLARLHRALAFHAHLPLDASASNRRSRRAVERIIEEAVSQTVGNVAVAVAPVGAAFVVAHALPSQMGRPCAGSGGSATPMPPSE